MVRKTHQLFLNRLPRQYDTYQQYPFFFYRGVLDKVIESHNHEFFEINLFESGSAINYANGTQVDIKPNDIVLGNQIDTHSLVPKENIDIILILFDMSLIIDQASKESHAQMALLTPFIAPKSDFLLKAELFPEELVQFKKIVDLLEYEYKNQLGMWQQQVTLLLKSLLTVLYRAFLRIHKAPPTQERMGYEILEYLNSHFKEDIKISELTKMFKISKLELNSFLKATSGHSFKRYLLLRRVNEAKYLLSMTNLPFDEIIAETGFQDKSNFYRVFQKITGKTPLKYRNIPE